MNTITTRQAAERLGVTMKRVQAMIRDAKLPAEKIGRDYLIQDADLALVANRKPGRPSKPKTEVTNGDTKSAQPTRATPTTRAAQRGRKI